MIFWPLYWLFDNFCSDNFCSHCSNRFFRLFICPFTRISIHPLCDRSILALSFLNYYGIKESVWVNTIFTLVEISGTLNNYSSRIVYGISCRY